MKKHLGLTKPKGHAAFTFIEVMVAMVIMSITFMAVLDSQSASISRATEAKFSTTATFLAQKKMSELEVLKTADLSSDSGDFGDDYPGYSWKLTLEITSFDADYLKQLDLTVTWGEDELYSYSLSQLRFIPK